MNYSKRDFLKRFGIVSAGIVGCPAIVRADPLALSDPVLLEDNVNKTPSALLTGLTAYWRMNNSAGTTRTDATGNGYDLTDKNSNEDGILATINGNSKGVTRTMTTHTDDCLFHAANSAFVMGSGVSFAFAGWFAGFLVLDHHILSNWDNGSNNAYLLFASSGEGQQIQFYTIELGTGTAHHLNVATVASMQSGGQPAWHHFAFGYDDASHVMWCQDNAGTRQTASVNGVIAHSAQFTIGNLSNMAFPNDGLLSDVGFWRRSLSTAEVTYLYNSGNPIAPAIYPFS